ncbi:ATP-binding protein [Neorhodopirellula pilleata]|uniref:histidine kinase n=1 Tax=Neorhodopirellula pilleata TaxID=2714738 RepID=A0A5C6AS11_9BACT|nr:ATP-binding protein [Neorhodopirellula pilleata]TWU01876.1 Sensor histidine kinase TmoS [Neorhodopirellula pilleata]
MAVFPDPRSDSARDVRACRVHPDGDESGTDGVTTGVSPDALLGQGELPMDYELTILLVEDDPDTCGSLRDILELDGHQVLFAGSLAQARQIVTDQQVTVVLLDRRLPDGSADDFLPELHALVPAAEIIVITGYADMDSTIAAFRDGATDYILKPINPEALRKSVERIAQRRHIENELLREQKFADIILSTAEAVVLVLDLKGKIIRFNPYFERISGWTLATCLGRDWFDQCLPPKDRQSFRQVFLDTSGDVETSGIINPILTRDGRQRQIRWSNTTLKDDDSRPYAVLGIGVDVTDLLTAQEQSLQSERLATIGRTITGLAHESRNALQRIQAGLEMLELELEQYPDARRDLDSIQRATHDLNNLLEEVRSFAAPIHLHLEHASLPEIWTRVWRHLEVARQGREVSLIESHSEGDMTVKLDVLRIEQVFRNLFENSLAAATDPVRIWVDCNRGPGDELCITVRDNGPGLSIEQREKVFEPFYTTKSTGTGLGMAIVQRIVQAHRGRIEVGQPPASGGAVFSIHLPSAPWMGNRPI